MRMCDVWARPGYGRAACRFCRTQNCASLACPVAVRSPPSPASRREGQPGSIWWRRWSILDPSPHRSSANNNGAPCDNSRQHRRQYRQHHTMEHFTRHIAGVRPRHRTPGLFYVRELVEDHIIRCPYVESAENLADFFTKAQSPGVFKAMRDRIMNVKRGDGDEATGGS